MGRLIGLIRIAALVAFVASLDLPLFETAESGDAWGVWALFFGWVYLVDGKLAWLANPLFLLCLFMSESQPRVAVFLSAIALAIAVFEYPYSYVDSLGFDSSRDIEEGRVTGLGIAARVWLASLVLSLAYTLSMSIHQRVGRRSGDAH